MSRTLGLLPLLAAVACQPQSAVPVPQDKGMAQFAKDKEFHSAHTLREPTVAKLAGKEVTLNVGEDKVKCYWDAPKEGHGQVVLMVHEWWGLNDNIRETADALNAETGYGVLAVDLYEGKVAKNADEAGKYMAAVKATQASATVNAALRAIKAGIDGTKPATKIGTVGYCFGGGWSHKAAIMGGKDVQACVVYYGMPSVSPGELERMSAPVLFVFAKKDKWINADVLDGFRSAMHSAAKPLEVEEYDADHAFANPSSKSYQSEAARDAWKKTLAFYKKNLG
ncbi:MAG: dienelactone hydrolase family protein [Armatimonadetes bacterium]|nr:dienelactone hydrolase family protein [Armatimonadota bacterium]